MKVELKTTNKARCRGCSKRPCKHDMLVLEGKYWGDLFYLCQNCALELQEKIALLAFTNLEKPSDTTPIEEDLSII